jgi:hypothetical protein
MKKISEAEETKDFIAYVDSYVQTLDAAAKNLNKRLKKIKGKKNSWRQLLNLDDSLCAAAMPGNELYAMVWILRHKAGFGIGDTSKAEIKFLESKLRPIISEFYENEDDFGFALQTWIDQKRLEMNLKNEEENIARMGK